MPGKKKRHSHTPGVIKLCSPHYDMLRRLHVDSCSTHQTSDGHVHVMQAMQPISPMTCQRCNAKIVSETVARSPQYVDPFNRVGQSETIYLSSTSPPTHFGPAIEQQIKTAPLKDSTAKSEGKAMIQLREEPKVVIVEPLEEKIRQEVKQSLEALQKENIKRKEENDYIKAEALEAKIRQEIERNQGKHQEERIQRLEAINYLAPRPEPHFCTQEKWRRIPKCIKDKDDKEPEEKKQQKLEQTSKEEFFECYLQPMDDFASRIIESHPGTQLLVKGLTVSETVLLDGMTGNDRPPKHIDEQEKQLDIDRAKQTNVNVNIKVNTPNAK